MAVDEHRFTTTCEDPRQAEVDTERRQGAGQPEDERQIVRQNRNQVDRELRTDGCVRRKIHGPVQEVAQGERAPVGHGDRERYRHAQARVQTGKEQQIDSKGQPVDQRESQKRRGDNGIEVPRKPRYRRDTEPVKTVGRALSAGGHRLEPHMATLPQTGIHDVSSGPTPCGAQGLPG
jgi:hypothetical protein